ncbi:MAG TPA: hypothetical protein VGD69_22850 [Herpetosiphonaceae bacterium]
MPDDAELGGAAMLGAGDWGGGSDAGEAEGHQGEAEDLFVRGHTILLTVAPSMG